MRAGLLLTRLEGLIRTSSFVRFLISGGLNTGATYVCYLLLLRAVDYKVAYTIAYVLGVALSFIVSRLFVFQAHRGWLSLAMFPLVYITQYLIGLLIVWAWIAKLSLPASIAPIVSIVAQIPLTFFMTRFVFGRDGKSSSHV